MDKYTFIYANHKKNLKLKKSQPYLETVWNAQHERQEAQYRHQRRPSPEELE